MTTMSVIRVAHALRVQKQKQRRDWDSWIVELDEAYDVYCQHMQSLNRTPVSRETLYHQAISQQVDAVVLVRRVRAQAKAA